MFAFIYFSPILCMFLLFIFFSYISHGMEYIIELLSGVFIKLFLLSFYFMSVLYSLLFSVQLASFCQHFFLLIKLLWNAGLFCIFHPLCLSSSGRISHFSCLLFRYEYETNLICDFYETRK